MQTPLTFRSSKIVYYGPHPCENCGVMITRMGREFGGNAFTYPAGPIYPNTEWHPHVCDPRAVRRMNEIRGIPSEALDDLRLPENERRVNEL
jgi:hypothetical protein